MVVRGMWRAACVCLIVAGLGWAQALPTSATIESVPLELTMPERYHVTSVLEPVRRVELVAPADGVVRSLDVRPGATVRDTQELAQLDRAEAMARLKMAQADVKEKQAVAQAASGGAYRRSRQAQLEAAEARAELAQHELDRLTLRAPVRGADRLRAPVSAGQFVLKGTVIAELADVTEPEGPRAGRSPGGQGRHRRDGLRRGAGADREGPERLAPARVVRPASRAGRALRLGLDSCAESPRRARAGPEGPQRDLAQHADRRRSPRAAAEEGRGSRLQGSLVQVIRSEYVTNVPVEVLGQVGPETGSRSPARSGPPTR